MSPSKNSKFNTQFLCQRLSKLFSPDLETGELGHFQRKNFEQKKISRAPKETRKNVQ